MPCFWMMRAWFIISTAGDTLTPRSWIALSVAMVRSICSVAFCSMSISWSSSPRAICDALSASR